VARKRDELQIEVQQAEVHQHVVELEAAAEELRLAKLEERLARYPRAAQWDWDGVQFEVARALAGNSRVLVHARGIDDLARVVMTRETALDQAPANGLGRPEPTDEPQRASRAGRRSAAQELEADTTV
jgi:hypothetical protein